MATSREVAEAFIEVHGDLSEFRKDLHAAGKDARAAGENMADDFGTGWNKRIQTEVKDRWESMLNAMYSDSPLDWNKLISKFDSTDLDRTSVQIEDFMSRMRAAGKLNARQYDEVSSRIRQVIKDRQQELFVQKDLEEVTRAHTQALAENLKYDQARGGGGRERLAVEREIIDLMEAGLTNQDRHLTKQQKTLRDIHKLMRENVTITDSHNESLLESIAKIGNIDKRVGDSHRNHRVLGSLTDKLRLSWARMDSTVRIVLGLILAAAGPVAVLGSGLAGAGTALASSLAYSVGALGAMVGPATAFGLGIALAINSFDEILARLPQIQTSLDRISAGWTGQADRFGREWEGALDRVLFSFASRLEEFDFGTPIGRSFAAITDGFNNVLNSPAFSAFMTEMTTNFPAALEGMGVGLSNLTGGFLSLFAGAGPVARQLGQDFQNWSAKIAEALERARASGEITRLFERMRESLLAVLDLAGSVGMALGTLFEAGSASGNRLLNSLTRVVDKFNEWAKSDAGRESLLTWFNNAERIIKSLEPVAVGLGKALAILVTPRMIDMFVQLMETVGEILPILGEMLKVVSDLGILNILADLLLVVGKALQPLLPPLSELAMEVGPLVSSLFEALAPLLLAVVKALVPLVGTITDLVQELAPTLIPALERLVEVITPIIVKVIEFAAAIAEKLLPVIGPIFTTYITTTLTAFELLAAGIDFVVTVVTNVLTELVNFFLNLGTNITNFNTTVNEGFAQFWGGIQTMFTNFITGFQEGWDTFWGGLGVSLTNLWTGIVAQFTTGWTELTTGFTTWVTEFQLGWDTFWAGLGEGLSQVWQGILGTLGTAWQSIVDGVNTALIEPFRQFWDAFWNNLDPELRALLQGIVLALEVGWNNIVQGLQKFIGDFLKGWNGFWGDVAKANDQKWRETVDGFNRWAGDINRTVSNFVNDVVRNWNNFWNDVSSRTNNSTNQIISSINGWANGINTTVRNFINSVVAGWNQFWNEMGQRVATGWNNIITGVQNGVNNVRTNFSNFVNDVAARWNAFWGDVGNRVRNAMIDFQNNVSNGLNQVYRWFGELPGNIGRGLAGLANQLWYLGRDMIMGLVNGVRAMAQNVINAVSNVIGGAINWAKSLLKISSPSKVFENFGEMTGEGYIVGLKHETGLIRAAAGHMIEGAFEAFNRSEAELAGREAGRGLADGLESSKYLIENALAKVNPELNARFATSVSGSAGATIAERAQAASGGAQTTQFVLPEGAVQVITKATDPGIVASYVKDELSDLFTTTSKL